MIATAIQTPTIQDYELAFAREAALVYPEIDALERSCGYAIPKAEIDRAARVLACPIKVNPPHWAHGRVLYATTRQYLSTWHGPVLLLDIGTAKGFSALCLWWALRDAGQAGQVVSVDVVDPLARVARNNVTELVHGLLTVKEGMRFAGHPDAADSITWVQSTGEQWLSASTDRVHVAFVDGKHEAGVVAREAGLLAARQQAGDLVIFDDVHMPGVQSAVSAASKHYTLIRVQPRPHRAYAVGVRR